MVSEPDTVLWVMMLSRSESAVLRARDVCARLIDRNCEPGYYSYCIKEVFTLIYKCKSYLLIEEIIHKVERKCESI